MRGRAALAALLALAACQFDGGERSEATVARWVDGDTVEVAGLSEGLTTVRLEGVDTPETRSYGGANECVHPALAGRATARAIALAPPGSPVDVSIFGYDRYGRTLARVTAEAGDVGEQLVGDGLARRWPDGTCLNGRNDRR